MASSSTPASPGADLSKVASVASFFISRVDTEIDQRLDAIGSPEALALRGKGAIAQGKLAYQLFQKTFSGHRWEALAAKGAVVQRPLWASTSTKNPAYPDTLYVDELIGPDTVNTLPDATIEAFADHGHLARRVDADLDEAQATWSGLTDGGRRSRRRRRQAGTRGRRQLPEELRRAARSTRDQSHRAARLTTLQRRGMWRPPATPHVARTARRSPARPFLAHRISHAMGTSGVPA